MITGTRARPHARATATRSALRHGIGCLAALTVLAGCSTGAEEDWNSTAVGDNGSVGDVELLSVLLVTQEEAGPARLLGTFVNNGGDPVEVTISDDNESVTVVVPADGDVPFDTVETLLQSAGDAPGARTMLTVSTHAGEVELSVPVVDGTLDPYRPYLPA